MADKLNLGNQKNLIARFDSLKDDIFATETILCLLMDYYVYGGFDNFRAKNTLSDMSQKDIYWFALEKAVKIVNQGSIYGKWLIGKELVQYHGFLSQDKALGHFLIEFAAHEGCSDACDYMAQQYHHYGMENKHIVIYWQNRGNDGRAVNKIGKPLPLYIDADDSETLDGSVWKTICLRSE
ncbi:MAG: hypothetical protein Q3971_01985 [Moraxella sp.]|nr:hypothetical protein [Moraxella sp.]